MAPCPNLDPRGRLRGVASRLYDPQGGGPRYRYDTLTFATIQYTGTTVS